MYAGQGVSELLRTHLMGHDHMQVAAVTRLVEMRQGDSSDEVLLQRVNVCYN